MQNTQLAATCIALIGLLLFGLSAAITLRRRATRTYFGFSADPSDRLYRLVRAHGNTAEYAGLLCALIWVAAECAPSRWSSLLIGIVTASRYCQAIGMLVGPTLDSPPNSLRLIGTTGTYVGGAGLSVALLAAVFRA